MAVETAAAQWDQPPMDSTAAKALEVAEMSRNLAETARAMAQQERKEAIAKLMEEQNIRAAAESALHRATANKDAMAKTLAQETREKLRAQEAAQEARAQCTLLQENLHALQLARQEADKQVRVLQERLDKEAAKSNKLDEQVGSLKTLTVQLKSDIKVEIAARKQLEKERSSLQRDLARQRDQLTQQVEDLRGSLGRDLRAERALRQRAEFGLQSATEERRTAEDRVTKMTLAQRDAVRQLEAEKLDRTQLAADLKDLQRRYDALEHANATMASRDVAAAASLQSETERRQAATAALEKAQAECARLTEELRLAQAAKEHMELRYGPERQRRLALESALREAEQSRRTANRSWRLAEQQVHDLMGMVRAAQTGRLDALEALARERSARLTAQQALDRAAQRMGPDGVLGAQEILNRDITIAAEQRALAVCQQGLEMLQKEAADLTRLVQQGSMQVFKDSDNQPVTTKQPVTHLGSGQVEVQGTIAQENNNPVANTQQQPLQPRSSNTPRSTPTPSVAAKPAADPLIPANNPLHDAATQEQQAPQPPAAQTAVKTPLSMIKGAAKRALAPHSISPGATYSENSSGGGGSGGTSRGRQAALLQRGIEGVDVGSPEGQWDSARGLRRATPDRDERGRPGCGKQGSPSQWHAPEVPLLTLEEVAVEEVVGDNAASLTESADSLWEQLRYDGRVGVYQ